MYLLFQKKTIKYVFLFVTIYCFLYYGTKAWIGFTTPGNYYSPFIQKYLDYIHLFRKILMTVSGFVSSAFGYKASIVNEYDLKLENGRGVHIVYSCLGIGVMSFWTAFVIANEGKAFKKFKWILGGIAAIFCINVTRVSLMLLAIANHWNLFYRIDNHLLFNIVAYLLIFVMIYLYDRHFISRQKPLRSEKK